MHSAEDQLPKPPDASTSPETATEPPMRLSPKPVRPAETPMDQPAASDSPTPPPDSLLASTVADSPPKPASKPPSPPASPKPGASAMPEGGDGVKPGVEAAAVTETVEPVSSPIEPTSSPVEPPATPASVVRNHPIPPASEPMQYRAIGLVRGKYTPSEEQFTRGSMTTEDGTEVQAVLLGRVMSLVKKHLDLETPHLWVVYPRTRDKQDDLHVQIVGVWEPDKLSKRGLEGEDGEDKGEDSAVEVEPIEMISPDELEDGYFSIRGEVMFQAEEGDRLVVRIQQAPKKGSDEEKAFKLNLRGRLDGKTVGYFWDLNVRRQESDLVVQDGTLIGLVPPRKRDKTRPMGPRGGKPGGFKKGGNWSGPSRSSPGPRTFRREGSSAVPRPSAPPKPREMGAPSKPIIKRPKEE